MPYIDIQKEKEGVHYAINNPKKNLGLHQEAGVEDYFGL